jgi:hypothetical protein
MFASQWFLTLLTYDVPIDISYKIIDLFILKGFKIIFKIVIAILMGIEEEIITMNYENTLMRLIGCTKLADFDGVYEISRSA